MHTRGRVRSTEGDDTRWRAHTQAAQKEVVDFSSSLIMRKEERQDEKIRRKKKTTGVEVELNT